MDFIPYGKQFIDDSDIDSVVEAMKSDYLTQGPRVEAFERSLCDYTGAKYCVAVSSATAALHIAVASLELKTGEGITSPNTFVASSNCLVYNKFKPVFADISSDTYNIDPKKIDYKITDETKLIVPVHFAGRPCDMASISKIAKQNNLYVIEDAAHAIGSCYEGNNGRVGNCKYSDMTVFSFHPVKTMTTGEGGAVFTNDHDLYMKLLLLRSHGITKDPSKLSIKDEPWYYEMSCLGYNYRITDIQAALGISQLKKIEDFKCRRKQIVEIYNNAFSNFEWLKTPSRDVADSCFHLYVLQIDFDMIDKNRQEVMSELKAKGIGTQVHYIPVHTHPYYQERFGCRVGDYPIAEHYYKRALSIPLYPKMTNEDVERVINSISALKG